jgi:hypothetical protein
MVLVKHIVSRTNQSEKGHCLPVVHLAVPVLVFAVLMF